MNNELQGKSKSLSKILRHRPDGYSMDKNGWVPVSEILLNQNLTIEELNEIVETNDKQRFTIEGDKIRANQGHSIEVDLEFKVEIPPFILYHGTGEKNKDIIEKDGIKKMTRHHVHLSEDKHTAKSVGQRHGKPFIFEIKARAMNTDGIKFYKSPNGVWLTDYVDPKYFSKFMEEKYNK